MRILLTALTLLAASARREAWDDLRWLGGGLRGSSCATQPWLRKLNAAPPQRRRLFDFGWRGPGGETSAPSEPWRDGAPADGLGLGLPLARLHARQMGGDVEVVSAPGYGTDAFLTVVRDGT